VNIAGNNSKGEQRRYQEPPITAIAIATKLAAGAESERGSRHAGGHRDSSSSRWVGRHRPASMIAEARSTPLRIAGVAKSTSMIDLGDDAHQHQDADDNRRADRPVGSPAAPRSRRRAQAERRSGW